MKRRDFLKTCLALLAGLFVAKWFNTEGPWGASNLKEARFYRSDDSLAG